MNHPTAHRVRQGARGDLRVPRRLGADATMLNNESAESRGAQSSTVLSQPVGQNSSGPIRMPLGRPVLCCVLQTQFLPSRRPQFRTARKVPNRPTDFSGPRVRGVRDRPTPYRPTSGLTEKCRN